MVSDDENADSIADDAKQKVVREPIEVDAANVSLADGKRLRSLCYIQDEVPQLRVKSAASSRLATRT
jgi:hypothetical protein